MAKLGPILDMRGLQLSVKRLQQLRTRCKWALGACSPEVCTLGLAETLNLCFEIELRKASQGSKLNEVYEVPEYIISMKALRLYFTQQSKSTDTSNLEHYSTQLRRAPHIEVSENDVDTMDRLLHAVESSRILRQLLHRKAHVLFLGAGTANGTKLNEKIEGHMAIQANSATVEISDIQDLHRRVQVVMTPNSDGTVPPVPRKFTSVHRELTSIMSTDGKQLIDSMIPNLSGPKEGTVTVVFRQSLEAERFVLALARDPPAFVHHLCLSECKFREDMVFRLDRSFTLTGRGRILDSTWNSETWEVNTPFSTINDTFLEELHEEGYTLPESFIVNIPDAKTLLGEQDQEKALRELGLQDDVTLATKGDLASIVSGMDNTVGDTSVRSTNTQDFYRNIEADCIAKAEEAERRAMEKWNNGSSFAPGFNPPTDSTSSIPQSNPTKPPHQQRTDDNNDGAPASEMQRGLGTKPYPESQGMAAGGPRGLK